MLVHQLGPCLEEVLYILLIYNIASVPSLPHLHTCTHAFIYIIEKFDKQYFSSVLYIHVSKTCSYIAGKAWD